MTMQFDLRRRTALLLAVVLLIVVCWAGSMAGTVLVKARSAALFDAERAIAQAASPLLQQDRIPPGLIRTAQRVLAEPELGLNYITLRNRNNVVLFSRGRLGDRFGWLPAGQARAWRGFEYRLMSADANRPLLRTEQRIGYAGFGVRWVHVFARAGAGLALWSLVLLAGLVGFCWALARGLAPDDHNRPLPANRAVDPPIAPPPSPSKDKRAGSAPLSRLVRRVSRSNDEFAPIADPDASPWHDRQAPAPTAGEGVPIAAPEAPPEPPVDEPVPQASAPPVDKPMPDAPEPQPAGQPAGDTTGARSHPAIDAVAPPAASPAVSAPEDDSAAARAEPAFGDSTLDLRFFPIWQDRDRQCLSGAWAVLAWRGGDGGLVDPETLTELAENTEAVRAFTQWIARRLSMLHGNWRTLELATVPILLPIPSAMLGFADAEEVWSEALERVDRDPSDLVLRLPKDQSQPAGAVLPVRRAIKMESLVQKPANACDALCISPENVENASSEEWRSFHEVFKRPVLLGPVSDPQAWEKVIAHEHMNWYSDAQTPENLHTPRSFARLLSKSRIDPI